MVRKIKRRLKLKVEKASGKDIKKLGVFLNDPIGERTPIFLSVELVTYCIIKTFFFLF